MNKTLHTRFALYNQKLDFELSKASALPGAAGGVDALGGQAFISCPPQVVKVVNFGIDTLHLTLDCDISDYLITALREQKSALQQGMENDCLFSFGVSNLFSFKLQRQGIKFYPYVLTCGDILLAISARKAGTTIPNMRVQIGSISCQDDLKNTLKMLRAWLTRYNCKVKEEKVSRIDLAADININISDTNVDSKEHRICRSGKANYCETDYKLSGFYIGKGAVMLRAYNKILEMNAKDQDYKAEFFQKKWGNVTELTRFEFQLRREFIKEIFPDDSSFSIINANIKDIWKYLTYDWFRLTEKKVDRKNKNHKQADTSMFWRTVQKASGSLYRNFGVVRNKKQRHINVKSLTKQAVGCLLSAVAGTGLYPESKSQIMKTIHKIISCTFSDKMKEFDFEKQYFRKMASAYVTF